MASYIHQCAWCGKTFTAGRRDKIYCSDACRNSAFYWKRGGGWTFDGHEVEPEVLKDELVEAFVSLHAAASVIAAAADDGNPRFRPVCKRVSDAVFELLKREGI